MWVAQARQSLSLSLVGLLDRPKRAGCEGADIDDWQPRAEATMTIMSSGCTTGKPKSVALSELNWEIGVATVAQHYPGADPVYLLATPVSHAAGGIAFMLLPRGPELIVRPAFEPEVAMRTIAQHRATYRLLPPTAIYSGVDEIKTGGVA